MIVAPLPAGHEETFMDLMLLVAMFAIAAVPVRAQAQQFRKAHCRRSLCPPR
jgi:hypothetical protein